MKLVCPECKSEVPLERVDMSSESALCCQCQKYFDCKEWIETALVTPENLKHPPDGALYEQTPHGFRVVVSTRAYRWLFFLPFACMWSALLLFFSWAFLHGNGSPGARLLLFRFLTPFYLFCAVAWGFALMPIFGRVAIEIDGDSGSIFKGIGFMGWTRHFDWRSVRKIRLSTYYMTNWNQEQITLEGDKTVQVARGVGHKRLCYMLLALCA
jgi:hypothetical protein